MANVTENTILLVIRNKDQYLSSIKKRATDLISNLRDAQQIYADLTEMYLTPLSAVNYDERVMSTPDMDRGFSSWVKYEKQKQEGLAEIARQSRQAVTDYVEAATDAHRIECIYQTLPSKERLVIGEFARLDPSMSRDARLHDIADRIDSMRDVRTVRAKYNAAITQIKKAYDSPADTSEFILQVDPSLLDSSPLPKDLEEGDIDQYE